MPIVKVEKSLESLIPKFLTYLNTEMANIQNAITSQDWATLQAKGHTLKGSCGGYGFDELGEMAKSLEQAAKQANLADTQTQVAQMLDYLRTMSIEYIE